MRTEQINYFLEAAKAGSCLLYTSIDGGTHSRSPLLWHKVNFAAGVVCGLKACYNKNKSQCEARSDEG